MAKNLALSIGSAVAALVLAAIIGIGGSGGALGGVNVGPQDFTDGFTAYATSTINGGLNVTGVISATTTQVGGGSSLTYLKKGTCNLILGATVAASSTGPFDCAVTGVQTGDTVFFTSPTTTPAAWRLTSANASSTNGYVTFNVFNGTAAAATPPATATSSIQVLIVR